MSEMTTAEIESRGEDDSTDEGKVIDLRAVPHVAEHTRRIARMRSRRER